MRLPQMPASRQQIGGIEPVLRHAFRAALVEQRKAGARKRHGLPSEQALIEHLGLREVSEFRRPAA